MAEAPRILVVDDEPKICSLLKRLLEREGYDVTACFNGEEALKEIIRQRPDLVVTDLKMPGLSGLELLRRSHSIDPDLPVVLVTGYASLETAVQALREGVEDYITKPFSVAELKGVVGRILQNRALAAENVRLLRELKIANAELEQHRERLTLKVKAAESDLGQAHMALERRLRAMEVLHEINRMTSTVIVQEEIMYLGAKLVQDKVGVDAIAVLVLNPEDGRLEVKEVRGSPPRLRPGDRFEPGEGALGLVMQMTEVQIVEAGPGDDRVSDAEQRSFGDGLTLLLPLRGKGTLAGALVLSREGETPAFSDSERDLIKLITHDLASALDNARLFEENERAYIDILAGLVVAMEARDPYLEQHSERVRRKALVLASALNLEPAQLDLLDTGARLHDLGKVGIEDRILHKPDALTEDEMATMRSHPAIGDRIVKPLGRLGGVKPIIRHHHEHWDGTGYPDGLAGEDIPLLAQIVTLVDAYDAMTSRRSYRDALEPRDALRILRESSGSHFNPFLVEVFEELERNQIERRPIGATGKESFD